MNKIRKLLLQMQNTRQFLKKILIKIINNKRRIHLYFKRVINNLYKIFPKDVVKQNNKKYFASEVIKYILILVFILTTITTFSVKKAVYNMSKEIITVENQIRDLEQEKYILKIEWSYLTSPERLMKIVGKTNLEQAPVTLSAKQIKKLKDLVPYYYAKSKKDNNVNPIAKLNF